MQTQGQTPVGFFFELEALITHGVEADFYRLIHQAENEHQYGRKLRTWKTHHLPWLNVGSHSRRAFSRDFLGVPLGEIFPQASGTMTTN